MYTAGINQSQQFAAGGTPDARAVILAWKVGCFMFSSLKVEIVKDGKVIRTVTLADPREEFCKAIRSLGVGLDARPQPVSRATRLASSKRASE